MFFFQLLYCLILSIDNVPKCEIISKKMRFVKFEITIYLDVCALFKMLYI